MIRNPSQECFQRYLDADGASQDPESILEDLLVSHARTVVSRVVRRRLGRLYRPQDAAELESESLLALLTWLRGLRQNPLSEPVEFDALATRIAANVVCQHFFRLSPHWTRLRRRLRYVLSTDSRLRLRQGEDGALRCGLASAPSDASPVGSAAIDRCRELLRQAPVAIEPLADLICAALRRLPGPIELSALTTLLSEFIGTPDPIPLLEATAPDEDAVSRVPDTSPSVLEQMELRQRLTALWNEIVQLNARQRAALLLNLKSTHGAVLCMLPDLGIVTFAGLAEALEISIEELAGFWNRLPLEDKEIAARLGLQQQQVINLRRSARERLFRRESAHANIPAVLHIDRVNP